MSSTASLSKMPPRDRVIVHACQAAANVLARQGYSPDEIANGLIAFGGAIAIERIGIAAASEMFFSKANGLREKSQ